MLPPCWPRPTRDRGGPALKDWPGRRRTRRSGPSSLATGTTSGSSATAPTLATRSCGRWPRCSRRIASEPGPADIRADAARFLAYSEATGAADALRPLARDSDPLVREAAAIGLTFLGQADHLESLRSIVSRPPADAPPVPRWQRVRLEEDPLIALAHQHSDAAVDILGAALLGDLKGLGLVNAGTSAGPSRGPPPPGHRDLQRCSAERATPDPLAGSPRPSI